MSNDTQHRREVLKDQVEQVWNSKYRALSEHPQGTETGKDLYQNLKSQPEYEHWLNSGFYNFIRVHWPDVDQDEARPSLELLSALVYDQAPIFTLAQESVIAKQPLVKLFFNSPEVTFGTSTTEALHNTQSRLPTTQLQLVRQ